MLLKGLVVLDASTLLPGPMCSLFFADLGAEVIKIESPGGDMLRQFKNNGKSAYFEALNRNKKSVIIDLKINDGKKRFMELVKKADVFIEGFRPGKMKSLGMDYENLKKINPKIIYCSISGYGQKGRYKNKAGHDINYVSSNGVLDLIAPKPFVPRIQIADTSSALIAAISILSALYNREKTGKGTYIDVSLFNSSLSLINIYVAQFSVSKNAKSLLSGAKPCYNIYETKDKKHISLGAIESKFWLAFCTAVKRKDLIKKQFDDKSLEEVRKIFKNKTAQEWKILNNMHDFCCEPLKKIEEVVNDKDLYKNGSLVNVDGIKQVGFPSLFSIIKKLSYKKAPRLGEHNDEVLK